MSKENVHSLEANRKSNSNWGCIYTSNYTSLKTSIYEGEHKILGCFLRTYD